MYLVIYGTALGVLLLLFLLYGLLGPTWGLGKIVEGADGRPSTSKLQWFLWTVVVLFSYVAIYTARAWQGHFEPIDTIPSNLLIAMGLSAVTMTAAKGITVSYVNSGKVVKSAAEPPAAPPPAPGAAPAATPVSRQATGASAIFLDDDGVPELSKIQMMAWTFIAIGTYLLTVMRQFGAALPELPDIAPALMVLMGLGQGAYLGKKLTTTSTPRLTGLSLGAGTPPLELTISGVALSDEQAGSVITVNGQPLDVKATTWKDTQITFKLPEQRHDGTPWPPGQRVDIGVIVGGQESINTLPFTIQA